MSKLIEIVNIIYKHFAEIEEKLPKLQSFVSDIMSTDTESLYTQFVRERTSRLRNITDLRHETITKIFCNARDAAKALINNEPNNIYNPLDISAPIIHYMHELQANYLLGVTSLFCHELSTGCMQQFNLESEMIDQNIISDSVIYGQNLVISLQHSKAQKSVNSQVLLHSKLLEHYTVVSSAYFWMNSCFISNRAAPHIVQRDSLLTNVQANCQSIEVWQSTLTKIQEDIEQHTYALLQLPIIEPLRLQFCDIMQQQRTLVTKQQQTCNQLLKYTNSLMRFELMEWGSSNLLDVDIMFRALLQQWQDTYIAWRHAGSAITPIEQDIVQLLDPEGKIDQCWINNISGLLDDMNFSAQRQSGILEREVKKLQDSLHTEANQLQLLIDASIRVETRHLLKSIAKVEKQQYNTNNEMCALVARARDLQQKLKLFYNKLSELQIKLTSREFTEISLVEIKERIAELIPTIQSRYMEFIKIIQSTLNNPTQSSSQNTELRAYNEGVVDQTEDTNEKDKKVNVKCQQQKRNAYAVSVWKRIRMKLEGRDPDPNRRSTITEQIEYIIREAMNPDNLAVLYEGWTPWV